MNQDQSGLSPRQVGQGLKAVIREGIMSHFMSVFTGGIFLVALALKLGASNSQIGLLAAIPYLSQLIQIPAILLVHHVGSRKKVVIASSFLGRCSWLMVAVSPFLFSPAQGLVILILAVFFQSFIGAVSGCAWNSWMRDLIPEKRMGRFLSLRTRIAIFLGLIASLTASRFVDIWQHRFPGLETGGYSLLFLGGCIAGLAGVMFMFKIPDIPLATCETHPLSLLKKPFKDRNYRRLLGFLGPWNFALGLVMPFFTVCMLKRLGLSMTAVAVMTMVTQLFNLIFIGLWGKWADHFSNKSVLAVSAPLYLFTILGWTLTSAAQGTVFIWPLLVALHMLMGVFSAGTSVGTGNIGLKLAPKGEATSYLVALSLVNAGAGTIASLSGGKIADFFAVRSLSIGLFSLHRWDFLFVIACLAGFYALRRLAAVQEKDYAGRKVVLNELLAVVKRPVRTLTTEEGVFQQVASRFKKKTGESGVFVE